MRSRVLALLLILLAFPVFAQNVTSDLKASAEALEDAAKAALGSAMVTSNPLNDGNENAGYFLTNACNNFWFETRQLKYWIVNKRPNLTVALQRMARCKALAAKIEKILTPENAVVLEGDAPRPTYPHVKLKWAAVTALMTKVEGLLAAGGSNPPTPAPPGAPPSPAPGMAPDDVPPAPGDLPADAPPSAAPAGAPAAPSATKPGPTPSPVPSPVPSPSPLPPVIGGVFIRDQAPKGSAGATGDHAPKLPPPPSHSAAPTGDKPPRAPVQPTHDLAPKAPPQPTHERAPTGDPSPTRGFAAKPY